MSLRGERPSIGNLAGSVRVETVQGTLETQEVDAVVLPIIYDDLLFTCAGQSLLKVVGPELLNRYYEANKGCEVPLGGFVLVEGLPGIQCRAVYFVNMIPWNNEPDGAAIQILRCGINMVLTSCDCRGFSSVSFPILGVGNALCVPDDYMTDVLQKEIRAFEQTRTSREPLLVHIVNHPSEKKTLDSKFHRFEDEDKKFSSMFEAEAKVGSNENLVSGGLMKTNPTLVNPSGVEIEGKEVTKNKQTVGSPGRHVHVDEDVVRGEIETQQVDAVVLPMIGHDPLSTCTGQTLFNMAGQELMGRFKKGKPCSEVELGNSVTVTNVPGLQCKAVIFLSLTPWDDDVDGVAVQVLRLGINSVLSSCNDGGFRSVAFPTLGVGNALCFPDNFLTQVLREEICAFEQTQTSCTPLNVHIVNPPSYNEDKWSSAVTRNTQARQIAGPLEGSVQVEIVQETLETQKVEALVSYMVFDDPLSTAVGQSLRSVVGDELMIKFKRQKADQEVLIGNSVLVEDLPGIPSKSVFFLSLTPWNEDPEGVAVEVLKLGINTILTYCDSQCLGSIAFPVLGAGRSLKFPGDVVAKVILEEISAFERDRVGSVPMLVRIVVHPSEKELNQVFKSTQEALKHKVTHQQDKNQSSVPKRIILLGKTGVGKSSLANTLLGEKVFQADHSAESGTKECKSATRSVEGRTLTLIDTPGLFDTNLSEEELRPKIMNCITECAPGPHAFLILLKVDKYTKQEQEVITQICHNFSEEALKFAVIVFTHGNQLREGMTIEDFVNQKKNLRDLVEKCGGRCHVFDNDYWDNDQPNNYRSNAFQRSQLLHTIDELVREKKGRCYTNDVLYHVGIIIQREEVRISRELAPTVSMTPAEITQKARSNVSNRFLTKLAAASTGALLGAFFGIGALVTTVLSILKLPKVEGVIGSISLTSGISALALGQGVLAATVVGAGLVGGIIGGKIALDATEGAESPLEAVSMAYDAIMERMESMTVSSCLGPPLERTVQYPWKD